MSTYHIIDFMKTNNLNISGDYSDEDHIEFLLKFKDETFNFDKDIKSLDVALLMPSKNRVANVNLLAHTSQDVISLQSQGRKPKPVGLLQFTLWSDGKREISKVY